MSDMATTVARTARTTPKKATRSKKYDMDAEMLEEFGPAPLDDELQTETFGPLYGETFRVLKTANVFNALQLGDIEEDSGVLTRYMISLVHPDDRKRFQTTLARRINLDVEQLLYIMRRMTEAVADGNPTNTSRGSSRSARRGAGKALSAAS